MRFLYKNKNWKIEKEYDINKILYLLSDKPYEITTLGGYVWINKKGELHRNYNLPAVIYCDGYVIWWLNNKKTIIKNIIEEK